MSLLTCGGCGLAFDVGHRHECYATQAGTADTCDHGIVFDEHAARGLSASDVRRRYPRLYGQCPKGCGYSGIGYASFLHYVSGDW